MAEIGLVNLLQLQVLLSLVVAYFGGVIWWRAAGIIHIRKYYVANLCVVITPTKQKSMD